MTKTAMIQTKHRARMIVLILVGLVGVVALVLIMLHKLAIKDDLARFQTVEKQKAQIVKQLTNYLGSNVLSTREDNECFNTEQGPYDNGYLWCQIASVVMLKSDVNFQDLGTNFTRFATALDLRAVSSGNEDVLRFWFDSGNHVICQLSSMNADGVKFGAATSDPLQRSDAPEFAIACADRAKAKHYPYIAE